MDSDVTEIVSKCKGCILAAKSPPTSQEPWPKTDRPWSRIHIDFAGPIDKFYYLVVVDSYSKWPEVFQMKRPTLTNTVNRLHELFARFGVVDTIVSEITERNSHLRSLNISVQPFQVEHIRMPPYHPRSNCLAERFVDTLKRALKNSN